MRGIFEVPVDELVDELAPAARAESLAQAFEVIERQRREDKATVDVVGR